MTEALGENRAYKPPGGVARTLAKKIARTGRNFILER
jgi:hypothetical protein